jgi:hypothetical protein
MHGHMKVKFVKKLLYSLEHVLRMTDTSRLKQEDCKE